MVCFTIDQERSFPKLNASGKSAGLKKKNKKKLQSLKRNVFEFEGIYWAYHVKITYVFLNQYFMWTELVYSKYLDFISW